MVIRKGGKGRKVQCPREKVTKRDANLSLLGKMDGRSQVSEKSERGKKGANLGW